MFELPYLSWHNSLEITMILSLKCLTFGWYISKLSFRLRIINTKVTESSWLGQSEVIVSLYKANGYDSPPAVPFTFLPRPRNVKCRGRVRAAFPRHRDMIREQMPARNDGQHTGFYVGEEFDNMKYRKLLEHYDFWHQAPQDCSPCRVTHIFRPFLWLLILCVGRIKQNKKIIVAHAKSFCPW